MARSKPPPLPTKSAQKPPPLPASEPKASGSPARRNTMEVDLAWLEEVRLTLPAMPAQKRRATLDKVRLSMADMPAASRRKTMEVLLEWLEPELAAHGDASKAVSVAPKPRKNLPSLPPPPEAASRSRAKKVGTPLRREEDD